MLRFFRKRKKEDKPDLAGLIAEGAVIIDVRTAVEFKSGHAPGTTNIPLQEIGRHVDRWKEEEQVVITCCASGHRSGIAARVLRKKGLQAHNGGTWRSVTRLVERSD